MKKILFVTLSIVLPLAVFSQDTKGIFDKSIEIYFQFEIDDKSLIQKLTKEVSIDNVNENTVYAYANENEFKSFLEFGLAHTILPHPNEGFDPVMATFEQIQNADNWNYYPTYDAYIALMYQFETDYPTLCDVFSIGQSVNGRELLVAKISDNVNTDEAEPEFFYTATMHGDEATGYPLMLNLIDSLLETYGSAPRITNLVNNIEIYINPLANPDGTYYGGNNSVANAIRYNANGYDLNRNFRDVVNGLHTNTQTETYHFMDFAEDRNFVMSANFHGGVEVVNYPWDHKYTLTADDAWWQYVSHEYADTCQQYSPSNYMNGFDDGITNGAAWYVIDGGRQDFMNYFHQCREVTLEISDTKLIPEYLIDDHWEYNRRSLLNYMEQVLFGVRGIITDAQSGLPMEAEVYVLNHEADSSWVYSEAITGNYHRLLNTGTYDIRFSAPCYETQIIYGVSIINKTTTTLDVQLQPSIADFTVNSTSVIIGEDVYFSDMSCEVPSTWLWSFSGPGNVTYVNGTNANSQDPVVQFDTNGDYTVSLTVTGSFGSDTETKTDYITVTDCNYCPSTYSNVTDDWITNVTFNTINNNSGQGGSDSYEDFTSVSTDVEPGQTYPISITFEMNGNWHQDCFAFIDWNRDCDFDDINESFDLGFQQNDGTLNSSITIPADASVGQVRFRIVEQYNQDPGPCDNHPTVYGETEDYTINVIGHADELDLKVLLQGPFNGIEMNVDVAVLPGFPLSQPFNTSPWNYTGSESVVSVPAGVVDWLLVEMRDATDANSANSSTMFARQAAFLLNDGSVVGMDGVEIIQELSLQTITNELFVVVYHQNHLPVMSANPVTESGGTYTYDFTTASGQAFGSNAQANLGGGMYGMYSGDSNADGTINDLDLSNSWDPDAGSSGYQSSDVNLDGQSDNKDKNDFWLPNLGQGTQVP